MNQPVEKSAGQANDSYKGIGSSTIFILTALVLFVDGIGSDALPSRHIRKNEK